MLINSFNNEKNMRNKHVEKSTDSLKTN